MTNQKMRTNSIELNLSKNYSFIHKDTLKNIKNSFAEKTQFSFSFSFGKGERAVFRTRSPIPVSLWAERHRVLHLSSRPGKWHNSTTRYTKSIMDASFFPSIKTIAIMKCPQSGGTELVHNCIGYAIDRAPGPVLYVYPDEMTARENAADRIMPMIQASSRLRSYMTGVVADTSAVRINLAHLTIHMAWSGSASRLGNKPVRYLVLDELDKYQNIKREASSEALAEKRVTTWGHKARIWKISTPTVKGSPIDTAFTLSEAKFIYYVACPYCGAEQNMDIERVLIPQENGEIKDFVLVESKKLARYSCIHCSASWSDIDRDRAVISGAWREKASNLSVAEHLAQYNPLSVAFHIPALISPFVSLSEIASKRLLIDSAPEPEKTKQDFYNNYLALPYEFDYEERKEEQILALCDDRPRGTVPGAILVENGQKERRVSCILAGADTQKRYFRYTIRAFGYGDVQESWLLQEGIAPTLEALEEILFYRDYMDSEGIKYKIRAVIIDAMGDPERTAEVYRWAVKNRGRVFPAQGVHSPSSPVSYSPIEYFPSATGTKVKIPGGIMLHRIDTTMFKGQLVAKMAINPNDVGAFHLYSNADNSLNAYASEMSAEVWNHEKNIWDNPKRRPNHAFDCEYLTQALAWMLNVSRMKKEVENTVRIKRPLPVMGGSSAVDKISNLRRN